MFLISPSHLGKSGIYAIAATQSNDFALGYPLLISLYANVHTDYPSYVYIIAPIQLVVLNSIGFFLLETEKHKHLQQHSNWYFLRILKGTVSNPIILMTILGLIWNFTYGNKIMPVFEPLIKALSDAFPAAALFLLGNTIAEQSQFSARLFSFTATILISLKILIFPIILQRCLVFMLKGTNDKDIQDLSSFGFLYGTIPIAPTVYVFATHYGVSIDVIITTIIFSTLFSAPLMYTSAIMISLSEYGFTHIKYYLSQTISFISCVNLLCCIWMLITFSFSQRWHSVTFGATLLIVLAQSISSVGGLLLFFKPEFQTPMFYVQYALSTGGIYLTRMATLFLAVLLFLLKWRSLCYILQARCKIYVIAILSFIITTLAICLIIAFLPQKNLSDANEPSFQLGFGQVVSTFVLTLCCFLGTVLCMILQHTCHHRKYNTSINTPQNATATNQRYSKICKTLENIEDIAKPSTSKTHFTDVEDMPNDRFDESSKLCSEEASDVYCDYRYQCTIEKRIQCSNNVQEYNESLRSTETGLHDNHQISKHVALLLLLNGSMILSLAVSLWKLVSEATNGIFIELEFGDAIFTYSQGIMCFVAFGLENELVDLLYKKWTNLKTWLVKVCFNETRAENTCKEFMDEYYEICKREISKVKIINDVTYETAFIGIELVNWIIENGLVVHEQEAENYCEYLLQGHIIENISFQFNFEITGDYKFSDSHCTNENTIS